MAKTIVGIFSSMSDAQSAADDLMNSGFSSDDISIMRSGEEGEMIKSKGEAGTGDEMAKGAATGALTGGAIGGAAGLIAAAVGLTIPGIGPVLAAGPLAAVLAGAGIGAAAGGIIGALVKMGVPEDEANMYAEGVRRGGVLLSANADDDASAQNAVNIMNRHNPQDIEAQAASWRKEGWSGFTEKGGREGVLPVAKEELKVGKREVGGGGVRIYSTVVEEPVEEDVRLREERAKVERHAVDRPVAAADEAFKERAYEVKETREEPVVEKSAHVVEEVSLSKEAREREEKIRDTLRGTEVKVDRDRRSPHPMPYNGPERRHHAGM